MHRSVESEDSHLGHCSRRGPLLDHVLVSLVGPAPHLRCPHTRSSVPLQGLMGQ